MAKIIQQSGVFMVLHKGKTVANMVKLSKNKWKFRHGDAEHIGSFAQCDEFLKKTRDLYGPSATYSHTVSSRYTVFTDASYCPVTKAIGVAWWGRSEGESRCIGNSYGQLTSSHEAEVLAALRGINAMMTDFSISGGFLVLVTDYLGVPRVIEDGAVGSLNLELVKYRRRVLDELSDAGVTLKINHVKAHKGTDTPRKWVNNFVDLEAKKAMKIARACLVHGSPNKLEPLYV